MLVFVTRDDVKSFRWINNMIKLANYHLCHHCISTILFLFVLFFLPQRKKWQIFKRNKSSCKRRHFVIRSKPVLIYIIIVGVGFRWNSGPLFFTGIRRCKPFFPSLLPKPGISGIVLFKSLRNCKRRNKWNFTSKSNSNKIKLCVVGGNIILF